MAGPSQDEAHESNPGSRVLSVYDALMSAGSRGDGKHLLLKVWSRAFDVHDASDAEDRVVALLQALRTEIALVRAMAAKEGMHDQLIDPGLGPLLGATTTTVLSIPWGNQVGNLGPPHVRLSLAMCAWALRGAGETSMAATELGAIQTQLNELEQLMVDVELEPFVRDFVERQVRAIRHALSLYRVNGLTSVKQAMRTVVGDVATSHVELQATAEKASEKSKSLLGKAAQLVKRTAEVCDHLSKIKKTGQEVYELSQHVSPFVTPLLAYAATKI